MHYYEVVKRDDLAPSDGVDWKGACYACDTFDEAVQIAESVGAELISEIGGSWEEFAKCWFCEEWQPITEINNNGCCDRCARAIWSREGGKI